MLGTLLVVILIAGLVWWLIDWAPFIAAQFKTIAKVVLVVFVVIYLVKVTGIVAWLNGIG